MLVKNTHPDYDGRGAVKVLTARQDPTADLEVDTCLSLP